MAENRLFLFPNMTLTHDDNFDNHDTLVSAQSASLLSPTHQLALRYQSYHHYSAVTVDNAQSNEQALSISLLTLCWMYLHVDVFANAY